MILAEDDSQPFFQLIIQLENSDSFFDDFGLYIAQQLAELNIEVEVRTPDPLIYIGDPLITPIWDMKFLNTHTLYKQDMREYYTENGTYNVFNLTSSIPYQDESEAMQSALLSMTDLEEENTYRDDWILLFMDKLLSLLPMFSPRQYYGSWANIDGYEARWKLSHSLPYMEFDGFHTGQESLDELNLASSNWYNLNPLFEQNKAETFITNLISEPMLVISPEFAPVKSGIIEDWEKITSTHFKFSLRDNLFWNPSFNITDRIASSDSLDPTDVSSLMIGLQGEYSDGTNQQVSAKDVVFSLLAYSNPLISDQTLNFNWLSECYVDEIDPLEFHIIIDQKPLTPEKEFYNDFWLELNRPLLPEFFLNSTSNETSLTTGGQAYIGLYNEIRYTKEWLDFSESAFSCGKYMLDYRVKNLITSLERDPSWFNIGAIDGTVQDLDISTVKIHIIPDGFAQITEFKEGNLDIIDVSSYPVDRKQMQADAQYNVETYVSFDFSFMAFNLNQPIIGGEENKLWVNQSDFENYTKACAVRKAICYAIDRDDINQAFFDSENLIVHNPVPMIYYYYGPNYPVISYNYDLETAWDWMERAGFERLDESNYAWITTCLVMLAYAIIKIHKKKDKKRLK